MIDSTYDLDLGSPITAIINLVVLRFSKVRYRQKNRRLWQSPHRYLVGELRRQPGSQGRQERSSRPTNVRPVLPAGANAVGVAIHNIHVIDYYCHSTIILILLLILFFYKKMKKVSFLKSMNAETVDKDLTARWREVSSVLKFKIVRSMLHCRAWLWPVKNINEWRWALHGTVRTCY